MRCVGAHIEVHFPPKERMTLLIHTLHQAECKGYDDRRQSDGAARICNPAIHRSPLPGCSVRRVFPMSLSTPARPLAIFGNRRARDRRRVTVDRRFADRSRRACAGRTLHDRCLCTLEGLARLKD